ncbi:hypothetical protein PQ610_01155 [Tardisphaera miroshnichenkoae]
MRDDIERGIMAGMISGLIYSVLVSAFAWFAYLSFPAYQTTWYSAMPFIVAQRPNLPMVALLSFAGGAILSMFFAFYNSKIPGNSSMEKGVFLSLWLMDISSAALAFVGGQENYFYMATPAVFFAPLYGLSLGFLFDALRGGSR